MGSPPFRKAPGRGRYSALQMYVGAKSQIPRPISMRITSRISTFSLNKNYPLADDALTYRFNNAIPLIIHWGARIIGWRSASITPSATDVAQIARRKSLRVHLHYILWRSQIQSGMRSFLLRFPSFAQQPFLWPSIIRRLSTRPMIIRPSHP